MPPRPQPRRRRSPIRPWRPPRPRRPCRRGPRPAPGRPVLAGTATRRPAPRPQVTPRPVKLGHRHRTARRPRLPARGDVPRNSNGPVTIGTARVTTGSVRPTFGQRPADLVSRHRASAIQPGKKATRENVQGAVTRREIGVTALVTCFLSQVYALSDPCSSPAWPSWSLHGYEHFIDDVYSGVGGVDVAADDV